MATFTEEGRANELADVAGVGGVNLYVRLYTNAVIITQATKLADIVQASWSGYAPYNSALWSDPFVDTNGDVVILSPVIVFPGPNLLPGATVRGFYCTLGTGVDERLWFIEALPTPQLMEFPTDQLPLRVQARLRYLAA